MSPEFAPVIAGTKTPLCFEIGYAILAVALGASRDVEAIIKDGLQAMSRRLPNRRPRNAGRAQSVD